MPFHQLSGMHIAALVVDPVKGVRKLLVSEWYRFGPFEEWA